MDFVLTSDLDWASEFSAESILAVAGRFSVKPTLFVTHRSPACEAAQRNGRAELALHPNFLPGSTHGSSIGSIADHIVGLAPEAVAWRSHRYSDSRAIRAAMSARGLRIDSNAHRHLRPGIAPRFFASGAVRLPVFFEDDIHWTTGGSWTFADNAPAFFSPGLKILNFHPFFVALNIADAPSYARLKPHIRSLNGKDAAALRNPHKGAGTFLHEALEAILSAGHRFITLSELVAQMRSAADRNEEVLPMADLCLAP